jgi:UDP-glucose 4,6-dehydratase
MIVLLGATGYLGRAFADELRRRGTLFIPLTRKAINYTQFEFLFDYVRKVKPSFLINCAGYTGRPDMDACEVQRRETVQANAIFPQVVARVCNMTNTPWAHISSSSIYAGSKLLDNGRMRIVRDLNRPEMRHLFAVEPERFCGFTELDEPNFSFGSAPCTFYSGTKALAEESLRAFSSVYIWRPGIVFDEFDEPRNLLSGIQHSAKMDDTVNSFSHRHDFVRACLDLWESCAPFGTYNVVNPGATSIQCVTYSMARVIRPDRRLEFLRIDDEFARSSTRICHPGCILNDSRIRAAGITMRPLQEALDDSLEKWQVAAHANEETSLAQRC